MEHILLLIDLNDEVFAKLHFSYRKAWIPMAALRNHEGNFKRNLQQRGIFLVAFAVLSGFLSVFVWFCFVVLFVCFRLFFR